MLRPQCPPGLLLMAGHMTHTDVVRALAALAHDARLAVFKLLVQAGPEGLAAGVLAERLGLSPSALSFHLKELTHAGLLVQCPDGRKILYQAHFTAMNGLIAHLTENCCQGEPCAVQLPGGGCTTGWSPLAGPATQFPQTSGASMRESSATYRVLFLCTANSARSVLAESLLNALGGGRFQAYSAGSHPAGAINPLALDFLTANGLPTEGLRSKSWDEFAAPGAPEMDFVITVCDQAAGEVCPLWPGQPVSAHWGVADPAAVVGPEAARRAAIKDAASVMRRRIELLLSLPLASLDRLALTSRLVAIGAVA